MQNKSKFSQLVRSLNKTSTIILVGFMGSGKSTMGKQLAQKFNYQFLDTDEEIEKMIGMSIDSIFKIKGEDYFRRLEHQFVQNLNVKNTVIATGGGLPCYYNNMEELNQIGVTVYLKYTAEDLIERLSQNNNQRPLIANKNKEELRLIVGNLLQERETQYLKAQRVF